MSRFVVRVWLPDRPGALGAVASRIGAVRGDVVGIDILEQGAGRAIDELVVELPEPELVDLMVEEIFEVDGVDVEDVRPVEDIPDARLDALETAAELVAATAVQELFRSLVALSLRALEADWSAVVDGQDIRAAHGDHPSKEWLAAFVAGGRSSEVVASGQTGPDDLALSALESSEAVLVLGRAGRPFRIRERRQLTALARIAGFRAKELAAGGRRLVQPARSR